MLRDTQAKPDASVLWLQLGQAQLGLKKYDDAEMSFKKALSLEAVAGKPSLATQGGADSGLGEIYARAGKVPEANAAYDAAAKINPASAELYLYNESVIFFQEHNSAAQAAAADEAIQADPTSAISYYLKGNGLVASTTVDPKTQQLIAPPGCLEAYQKYLELAPNGPYASEVKGILAGFGEKVVTTYKAPKGKK
jgi:tetratricopeptide (TPR) repeat protein